MSRDPISPSHNDSSDYKYGRFDASALHIQHALKQTEIQKSYSKPREKPIDSYLVCVFNEFYKILFSMATRTNISIKM